MNLLHVSDAKCHSLWRVTWSKQNSHDQKKTLKSAQVGLEIVFKKEIGNFVTHYYYVLPWGRWTTMHESGCCHGIRGQENMIDITYIPRVTTWWIGSTIFKFFCAWHILWICNCTMFCTLFTHVAVWSREPKWMIQIRHIVVYTKIKATLEEEVKSEPTRQDWILKSKKKSCTSVVDKKIIIYALRLRAFTLGR